MIQKQLPFFTFLSLFILFSCSSDDDSNPYQDVPSEYLVEDTSPSSDFNPEDWMDLVGIPFYVKSVESDNYLAAPQIGERLTLTHFEEENEDLLFSITQDNEFSNEFMLISVAGEHPVGVKSMNSIDSLLVPINLENTQERNRNWRFIPGANPSSIMIESADYAINENPFVFESTENSVYLASKNASQNQQFEIILKGDFEIENIEFDIESGEIVNEEWILLSSDTLTNPTDEILVVHVEDQYPNDIKASFTEIDSYVDISLTTSELEMGLPYLDVPVEGVKRVGVGRVAKIEYSEDTKFQNSSTSSGESNLRLSTHSTHVYNNSMKIYHLKVPYKITFKNPESGAMYRKKGIWRAEYPFERNTSLEEITE